jgi:hypothetical protein
VAGQFSQNGGAELCANCTCAANTSSPAGATSYSSECRGCPAGMANPAGGAAQCAPVAPLPPAARTYRCDKVRGTCYADPSAGQALALCSAHCAHEPAPPPGPAPAPAQNDLAIAGDGAAAMVTVGVLGACAVLLWRRARADKEGAAGALGKPLLMRPPAGPLPGTTHHVLPTSRQPVAAATAAAYGDEGTAHHVLATAALEPLRPPSCIRCQAELLIVSGVTQDCDKCHGIGCA